VQIYQFPFAISDRAVYLTLDQLSNASPEVQSILIQWIEQHPNDEAIGGVADALWLSVVGE